MRALALLLLTGCAAAEVGGSTEPEPPVAVPPAPSAREQVAELLHGHFRSDEQAADDERYFDISMKICTVNAPDYGDFVLYVEQAQAARMDAPYRQRLYVLETDEDEVISQVWAPTRADDWVGFCEAEDLTVPADAFRQKLGCEVYLTKVDDAFEGGTRGEDCESRLGGASYAVANVRIDADELRSWDRGYNAMGEQVWGAEAGPYHFRRVNRR